MIYEADPRHTDLFMSSLNLNESNSSSTPGVKPTDRDEFAEKSNEGYNFLHPDAVIAAICRGDPLPSEDAKYGYFKALTDHGPRRGRALDMSTLSPALHTVLHSLQVQL